MPPINTTEVVGRIKYLMKALNCRQNELAERIGVDTSNLSKYLNGRLPISEGFLNKMVVNLGVSKQWLVEGRDLPFEKVAAPTGAASPHHVTDAVVIDALENGRGTPVYDVDVTAGTLPRERLFAGDRIMGWINLPDLMGTDCRIVRVSGDSMSPVIKNGDLIAVRDVTNRDVIFWGQIYVVLLADYRMVKYVRRHNDPDKLILRSENGKYDDIEVRRDDVIDLMFVQHIIHVESRV